MTITAERGLQQSPYRVRYDLDVAKRVMMGIQELRLRLRERVAATQAGEHTVFTRHGRPIAVLVNIDWYRKAIEAVGEDPLGFDLVAPPNVKKRPPKTG